jgi:hypothetical protein
MVQPVPVHSAKLEKAKLIARKIVAPLYAFKASGKISGILASINRSVRHSDVAFLPQANGRSRDNLRRG